MSAATLTSSSTTAATPSAIAGTNSDPSDLEGQLLREMHAAAPDEAAKALLSRHRPKPDGFGDPLPAQRKPQALKTILGSARGLMREHLKSKARMDYVASLSAGGDATPAPFSPPDLTAEAEAEAILRGILGKDPLRFIGLVELVDATLASWRDELAGIAKPGQFPSFAEIFGARAGSRHDIRESAMYTIDAALELQAKKRTRSPELSALIDRLSSARDRLGQEFGTRINAAIASAGGVEALGECVRESSRLTIGHGAVVDTEAAQAELADVESKLAKLGIDPAKGQVPVGLAAKALAARYLELTQTIGSAFAESAKAESATHSSLISRALEMSGWGWSKILASCQAEPSAFPTGFEASWKAIPIDALVAAGAADFVEPFEAS